MKLLLERGLRLSYFDEPAPVAEAPAAPAADYVRAPWFLVMEWVKTSAAGLDALASVAV
jgi:hypothetical protein